MRNQATAEGGYNQLLKYTYDGNGRITHYERGSNDARYSYDESGQLTREDNEGLGKSWTWKYDAGGNIREKHEYAYTTGTLVVVEQVQHEILEAPVTVYNFEVADYHTYFVGTNGVLVHNSCSPQKPSYLSWP